MRLGENGVGRNALQSGAGLRDHRGEPLQIQRHEAAVGRLHMQRRRGGGRRPLPRNLGLGALARALRAIEHIGARDLVMLAAHQRKFGLILNVLDVKGAPGIGAARQSGDDLIGEFGDDVMHAREAAAVLPSTARKAFVSASAILEASNGETDPLRRMT